MSYLHKMKRVVLNPKLFKPQNVSPSTTKSSMGNPKDDLLKSNFLHSVGPFTKINGDFYCCIRPLLRLGRILGVVPVSGIFGGGSYDHLQFRWRSFATATSVLIVVALALNAAVNCIGLFKTLAQSGGGNAADIAAAARSPIFCLAVVIMYAYFISKSSRLITLFSTWRKSESDLILKTSDAKLSFHIKILVAVVYTSALVGLILTNLIRVSIIPNGIEKNYGANNETEKFNRMEVYFQQYHPFWVLYFPYNSILSILLLLLNSLSFLAWNFVDVVIIAFARALGFKFKTLVEETESRLMSSPSIDNPSVSMSILRGMTWADVRKDHMVLCKLLDDFNSFLSPLIFLSYSINIFLVGLKIHQGLNPSVDRSFMEGLVSAWSFFHLVSRIVAISLTASKINDYAHRIVEPIQKCASRDYCREVERLERMLGTMALGLNGLGCFVISRAFILVVVSVIFTMEIVFLQATALSPFTSSI